MTDLEKSLLDSLKAVLAVTDEYMTETMLNMDETEVDVLKKAKELVNQLT